MTLRMIEATFEQGSMDTVKAAIEGMMVLDVQWLAVDTEGMRLLRVLTQTHDAQPVTDRLQTVLGGSSRWRLTILPVEATMPAAPSNGAGSTSREELYQDVSGGAEVNGNFLLLTVLSVVVVGIGLNESNVAVIIGAMVIAPLLGPNLAMSVGAALGDITLLWRALVTNAVGVGFTLTLGIGLALLFTPNLASEEILARTRVGPGDLALALASGAAAALSVTTGLSSALVGVMVAVALMPPAVVTGMAAGAGEWEMAGSALLLLAVNVVCLNVSSQLVLIWKGIRPRTVLEKRAASAAVRTNLAVWGVLLAMLATLVTIGVFG